MRKPTKRAARSTGSRAAGKAVPRARVVRAAAATESGLAIAMGSVSLTQPDFSDVSLIGDRANDSAFADLGGGGSIDDPAHMLRGWTRLEAVVGEWNTVPSALLEILAAKRRAVARIMVPPNKGLVDFSATVRQSGWSGTGFIVGDTLLLTNHHVLNSIEVAREAEAEFDYEVSAADLAAGKRNGVPSMKRFRLNPDRLFVTSKATDGGLDYTFVWIDELACKEFGLIGMERASFTVQRFDPVFIVHHPQGRLKEVSLDDTETLRMRSTVIHYAADTDYGSSGSPVFDRDGRLIALHHARNADAPETLQDGRKVDVVNEGVKISAIALDLEARVAEARPDATLAEKVLACMSGSDTLASFFGGLGRQPRRASAVEAVVDIYTGTEQDVDVGFWNIEWLAGRDKDPAQFTRTATVLVDLNLDIWCLSEASPAALEALIHELKDKFGETYEVALAESEAPEARHCTAVIWKPRTVHRERIAWPAPIRQWWQLEGRSDLPFEAVGGRIFDRHPGLFRFSVKGRDNLTPFAFNLVPINLKAMGEGSKRRRLASLLLARAIRQMAEDGDRSDWLVGGDVTEELSAADFEELRKLGYEPMSATDASAGTFAYLKAPRSLIDNIFLSPNVDHPAGGDDYFVVAKDKSVDKFVKQVSDHRPVVLRVSLADGSRADTMADADLRALVERIASGQR